MKTQLTVLIIGLLSLRSNAQCAMCRAQLESMDDNSLAESVNDGIVYLMAVPYILVAFVGFMVYRGYKKSKTKKV
ncbi:MAG: hypothetical protein ACPGU9_05900 [Flavobacteriaceae bacterium]